MSSKSTNYGRVRPRLGIVCRCSQQVHSGVSCSAIEYAIVMRRRCWSYPRSSCPHRQVRNAVVFRKVVNSDRKKERRKETPHSRKLFQWALLSACQVDLLRCKWNYATSRRENNWYVRPFTLRENYDGRRWWRGEFAEHVAAHQPGQEAPVLHPLVSAP